MKRYLWLLLLLWGAPPASAQEDGAMRINELLPDPNGSANFDTDGNGSAAATDEYVELYNSDAAPQDISGWELWDSGAGRWFVFPAGSLVAPGGFAAVVAGVQDGGTLPAVAAGSLIFDAGRGSGVVNNGGDNVVVYDPALDRYWQLVFGGDAADDPPVDYAGFSPTAQQVGAPANFGPAREGVARTRAPDGGADIVDHDTVAGENGSPGRSPGAPSAVQLARLRVSRPLPACPAGWALALTLLTAAWFGRRQLMAGACRRKR